MTQTSTPKDLVINWLESMINQQVPAKNLNYEVKVKQGKFIGKTANAKKKLLLLSEKFTQLDKNLIPYELQTNINIEQFKISQQYLSGLKHWLKLRIDINFSNKDQRASIIYDERLELESESQVSEIISIKKNDSEVLITKKPKIYRGHGVLVEKQKSSTNQIDIIDDISHLRISLGLEKIISTSLKDILKQLGARQDRISLIRVKESLVYEEEFFDHSLSTVHSIFKSEKQNFETVMKIIQDTKYYNAKEGLDKVFSEVKELQVPYTYEIEQEIKAEIIKDKSEKLNVEKLLGTAEKLSLKINPYSAEQTDEKQEICDNLQKKVKQN